MGYEEFNLQIAETAVIETGTVRRTEAHPGFMQEEKR